MRTQSQSSEMPGMVRVSERNLCFRSLVARVLDVEKRGLMRAKGILGKM